MATKSKLGISGNKFGVVILDANPDDYVGVIYSQPAAPAGAVEPEPSGKIRRVLGDGGLSLLKGAIGVPEAAVGLADIATGGRVGKFLENEGGVFGFRPKQAQEYLDQFYTPEQKAAFAAVQSASKPEDSLGQNILNVGSAAIQNPSTVLHAVGQSIPSMLAGGVIGRGLMAAAPRIPGFAAAGIGEGVVSAGSTATQVRQETGDGLLTGKQALVAAGSGALTAGLGVVAGKAAKAMGVGDIDTLIVGGKTVNAKVQKAFVRRVIEGAFSEGVLEEMGQGIQERVAQNFALGKPLDEGVDHAAVMGLLSGGVMGAGAQVIARPKVPEVGPMSRAANLAVAGLTSPGSASTPPPVTRPVVDLTPEQSQELLDHANKRAAELTAKAKGTKGVDGAADVPGQFLTPGEQGEQEFLKAAGGDVQALVHAYQLPMPAPDAPINDDAAISRMERDAKRQEAESQGRSRAAGNGSDEGAAPAAPAAPKVSTFTPQAPAGPLDESEYDLPAADQDDILNPRGDPFKERFAAKRRRANLPDPENYTVIPVAGGFAVRRAAKPQEQNNEGAAPTSANDAPQYEAELGRIYTATNRTDFVEGWRGLSNSLPSGTSIYDPETDETYTLERKTSPSGNTVTFFIGTVTSYGGNIFGFTSKADGTQTTSGDLPTSKSLRITLPNPTPQEPTSPEADEPGTGATPAEIAQASTPDPAAGVGSNGSNGNRANGSPAPFGPSVIEAKPAGTRGTSLEDILNPKGQPFKTKLSAIAKQKELGYGEVIEAAGGWVVRPNTTKIDMSVPGSQPTGTRGTNAKDVLDSIKGVNVDTPANGAKVNGAQPSANDAPVPDPASLKDRVNGINAELAVVAAAKKAMGTQQAGEDKPTQIARAKLDLQAKRLWQKLAEALPDNSKNAAAAKDAADELESKINRIESDASDTPAPVQAPAKPSRGPAASQAWVDEGKTPDDLRAEKVGRLADELAGMITSEASEKDFAPTELPAVIAQWAKDGKVPADDLRQALIKALDKNGLSAGRMKQIRDALSPTKQASKEPGTIAEPAQAAPQVEQKDADTRSAVELAQAMDDMRKKKPRPLDKLYGKKGPTPEQKAEHAEATKKWEREYRKLSSAQKVALERDNAAFREKKDAEEKPKAPKKPAAPKAAEAERARADYFTPGNIVKSYSGFDEVLEYNPTEGGGFNVRVHAVQKVGDEWHRVGKPQDARGHSTQPDARALASGPVARLPYQAASEVVYTEPRADGAPFPNAVDRGVAPVATGGPGAPTGEITEPATPEPVVDNTAAIKELRKRLSVLESLKKCMA